MSRIAKPAFNGSPHDDLQTVDVYGAVDTEVRNKFVTAFSAFGQDLEASLGRQQASLTNIYDDFAQGRIDLDAAKDRLRGVLKGSRGVIDDLSQSVQDSILGGLGVDPNQVDRVRLQFENTVRTIQTTDLGTATGVAALLKDVTGNELFTTLDMEAYTSVLKGAVEELSAWGVPALVDTYLTSIEDPEVKREVIQRSTDKLSQTGDIDSIEVILNQVDASALTSGRPDFPKRVLQRYTFKDDTTPADYPARLTQLVSVMNRLQWDWIETQRQGETVWNYAIVQFASDDARQLLLSDAQYRVPVLTAEYYPERDVRTLAKDLYPLIAL